MESELGTVDSGMCPSRLMLDHLTSRWAVLALRELRERTFRFTELRRQLDGVSEKVLAQTLQTLERDGLVLRTAYPEVPPRVEYSLTDAGLEAAALVAALAGWVEQRIPQTSRGNRDDDASGPSPT